jgi:hypothetical protein
MTSGAHHRSHDTARAFVNSRQAEPRMTLKLMGAAKGFFDGGWWPRSQEPVTEFSALVSALRAHFGSVDRIGFNLVSWDMAPWRLVVAADTVRLEGFRGLNPHTVILIGPHLHRLTLLVVPAGASTAAARTALSLAAANDNTDDATRIFAASGVLRSDAIPGVPGPRGTEHGPEECWQADTPPPQPNDQSTIRRRSITDDAVSTSNSLARRSSVRGSVGVSYPEELP